MIKKEIFDTVKYFVADLDGTVYLKDNLIDGAKEFFEAAVLHGKDYYFLTNNSSNNSRVCLEKLCRMNFPVPENKILVSTDVTLDYINMNYPGKSVYLIGNENLYHDFIYSGIPLNDVNPDIVVVGFDNTLDYNKILKGCNFIINGAVFIATHPDIKAPMGSYYMPDAGSICALFSTCTGVNPIVMGKPEKYTSDFLTRLLKCSEDEICIIGDSLAADIALGVNNGMKSVCVLTGVTTPEIYSASDIKADIVVPSIKDLLCIFE